GVVRRSARPPAPAPRYARCPRATSEERRSVATPTRSEVRGREAPSTPVGGGQGKERRPAQPSLDPGQSLEASGKARQGGRHPATCCTAPAVMAWINNETEQV